jgi:hypothetical protein
MLKTIGAQIIANLSKGAGPANHFQGTAQKHCDKTVHTPRRGIFALPVSSLCGHVQENVNVGRKKYWLSTFFSMISFSTRSTKYHVTLPGRPSCNSGFGIQKLWRVLF